MLEIKTPVVEGMEELVTPMVVERIAQGLLYYQFFKMVEVKVHL